MRKPEPHCRHVLPRAARLAHRRDYQRIFAARRSAADENLVLYAEPNDLGRPRLGLAVPGRIGNAVMRNRCKRLLREAFRLSQHDLPSGYDYIAVPRAGGAATLKQYLASLRRLAGLATGRPSRSARKNEP